VPALRKDSASYAPSKAIDKDKAGIWIASTYIDPEILQPLANISPASNIFT
jgi:hypothetical protein